MDRVSMDIEILNVEMPLAERAIKESVTLHLCTYLNTCMHAFAAAVGCMCTNYSNTVRKKIENIQGLTVV